MSDEIRDEVRVCIFDEEGGRCVPRWECENYNCVRFSLVVYVLGLKRPSPSIAELAKIAGETT